MNRRAEPSRRIDEPEPGLFKTRMVRGGPFVAAIARGYCYGTQFHPEKSQARGLQIYRNFVALAAARQV